MGMDISERKISIILPVFNESKLIVTALKALQTQRPFEIIVVDGGSTDGTIELVKSMSLTVRLFIADQANRAYQQNLGAKMAEGDVFLFLHVDMKLPVNALKLIDQKLPQNNAYGGFKKQYSPQHWFLSIYGWGLNQIYLKWSKSFVGTNALFITRHLFQRLGGFPDVSAMEDVAFSRCLKKEAAAIVLDQKVTVSSRRYMNRGVWRQIFKNACLLVSGFRKRSPLSEEGALA